MISQYKIPLAFSFVLAAAPLAMAAVSNEEAAALKSTLTPFGGERAGNKAGTIPPWEGGIKPTPLPANGKIPDLFGEDKPLFTITPKNMAEYADKLTEGVKALLQKFPATYRVVVYPTRRTAAAPQWVYDNTFRNATRAQLDPSGSYGPFPVKAYGGIPFPIPKSGEEAIWNHILKWSGTTYSALQDQTRVTPEGKAVVMSQNLYEFTYPYYRPDWDGDKWVAAGSEISLRRVEISGPPIRAGEMGFVRQRIDDSKTLGYSYLTGQRRVRRIPVACCDVPSPISGGIANFDEVETFSGGIGRYDWKLVGKREMYLPYNANKMHQPKNQEEVIQPQHVNPDMIRYELHRVWVVEATLKAGERHSAPKARFYLDEDTWMAVAGERWDAQGKLWKVSLLAPTVYPGLPLVHSGSYIIHDMARGGYYVATFNRGQEKAFQWLDKPWPDGRYTPESLSGEGVR